MKEKKEEYQEEENRQQEQAKKIRGNGFDAQVFVTEWELASITGLRGKRF